MCQCFFPVVLVNADGTDKKLAPFLENFDEIDDLIDYFNKYKENLSKKTLNSYLKSVSNQ